MSEKYYPYGRQSIHEEDIAAVVEALRGDFLTGGPGVAEFEARLAEYTGARYAVAVSSGTAALHTAYMAAELSQGDELITTPFTFAATANAALYGGAKPVFVDIKEDTGNIGPDVLPKAIGKKSRIVVPVHYAGQPCDMEEIKQLSDTHGFTVIEDACHALGASYKGTKTGSCTYSDMTVLSFHPVKHITTGEGGAVMTNSKTFYDRLKLLRNHGIGSETVNGWFREMVTLGYNYRLTDIQGALGKSQLGRLDNMLEKRRRLAAKYGALLKDSPFFSPLKVKEYVDHAYHLYAVLVAEHMDRDAFILKARENNIGLQVHYRLVYKHPYYVANGYEEVYLPRAERISERVVSLPLYPDLESQDIEYIVEKLTDIAGTCG